jgi:hypothetical protein
VAKTPVATEPTSGKEARYEIGLGPDGLALSVINTIKVIAPTAVTAGTRITVWTPAAGKRFRLMGYVLSTTVAGEIIFGDNAVGTVIMRTGLLAANNAHESPPMGEGVGGGAVNNVLKLDVTVSGTVQGMVFGTED